MPPQSQQTPPQTPQTPQEPAQSTPPPQTPPNQPLQGGPAKRPMWPLVLVGVVLVALVAYGVVYWFVLK